MLTAVVVLSRVCVCAGWIERLVLVTVVPSRTEVRRTVVVLAGSIDVAVWVLSNVETIVDVLSKVETITDVLSTVDVAAG